MFKERIYLIGAGSHAKVIMTTLEACGIGCKGIFDDDESLRGQEIWGVPILGTTYEMPDTEDTIAVIGIASNRVRKDIADRFRNVAWPVIIHPLSLVHSSVRLGKGCAVLAGSVVQADTVVGNHSIISTCTIVDHDCRIGNYCHLSVHSCIADGVSIGDGACIGIGSIVTPCVNVGEGVLTGAGSTIISDLAPDGVYVGSPARRVPKISEW